ncbi:MAG TPA: ABC transporter substrate-binding protein [Solirubrobacterales bacterium]
MNRPLRGRIDTHLAIAAAAGIAVTLGLAACGGGGGNGPGSTELNLVIGNSLPLTGSSKSLGESGRKASALALARIKQAVGSERADHNVRIVNEDQGSNPGSAVETSRKLVGDDGATCLTGPWSSEAVAEAAHDVAVPGKVLEISPVATGENVAELSDHDLVDSTALPTSAEGEALAKAIEQDLGGAQGHTVNVVATTDTDSNAISQDFIETWQDDDGTVGRQIVLPSQPSLLSSNSPDAVVLVDDPVGFAQLAPTLAGSGWDPATAWGNDRLASPGLPGEVGARAVEGMRALAPGAPSGEGASSAFDDAFRSAPPRDVREAPFAAQEFDATILCYLAAVAAGSTDGQKMADKLIDITAPGGTQYSWQQLPDAIKALEDGEDIDYTGASGPLDMDVHGDPTKGVFAIYRYAPSGLKVVGEVPVEKPNPATP